jgi:hypothetical protein
VVRPPFTALFPGALRQCIGNRRPVQRAVFLHISQQNLVFARRPLGSGEPHLAASEVLPCLVLRKADTATERIGVEKHRERPWSVKF